MRTNPCLYEINSRLFLNQMSRKYGHGLTLATIPEEEWQSIAEIGFDLVWLMGVWQRSPGAKSQAVIQPELRKRYDELLPGWNLGDVDGSPYAIYTYTLSQNLGDKEDFKLIKSALNNKRLKFMVDFVPNHFALDTPLLRSNPGYFVHISSTAINKYPELFYSQDGINYFAHGRDPNFPSWSDTVQLNYFSVEARAAMINELRKISDRADGVRCDMAMLILNNIFEQVWGWALPDYAKPRSEFWKEAISTVKKKNPEFLFVAEAYWGMEQTLLNLGFDFVYNKTLYDSLLFASASEVRSCISTGLPLASAVNFVENHDEPRAVAAFGRERSMAAAVVVTTLPGLRMFNYGQLQGRRVHLPVQMITEPSEVVDGDLQDFYFKLLTICNAPVFHDGKWELLETHQAWKSNRSHQNLLAWSWLYDNTLKIVAINYSSDRLQARIKMPMIFTTNRPVIYRDELTGSNYEGNADEINSTGLYVDLDSWKSHIMSFLIR